jgi:hypothetical protein
MEERRSQTTGVTTTPVTPTKTPSDTNLAPVALVGVGVVGLGTATAMGLRSRGASKQLDTLCVEGICPADAAPMLQTEKRSALAADIGLVVGAVALGTGTALWLIEDSTWIAPAPGGITIGGQF